MNQNEDYRSLIDDHERSRDSIEEVIAFQDDSDAEESKDFSNPDFDANNYGSNTSDPFTPFVTPPNLSSIQHK